MASKDSLLFRISTCLSSIDVLLAAAKHKDRYLVKCQRVLDQILALPTSVHFIDPVQNVRGYKTVIKEPICLREVEQKLKNGQYSTSEQFVSDLRRIVSNCYTFNPFDSVFSRDCREMELKMETLFVTELDFGPPPTNDFSRLCRFLDGETRQELVKIICAYEKWEQQDETNFQFTPDLLQFATRRAVMALLRSKKALAPAPILGPKAPDLPTANNITPARKRPRSVMEDEVVFHQVEQSVSAAPHQIRDAPKVPPSPRLQPLMQNKHSTGFYDDVSPVHSCSDFDD